MNEEKNNLVQILFCLMIYKKKVSIYRTPISVMIMMMMMIVVVVNIGFYYVCGCMMKLCLFGSKIGQNRLIVDEKKWWKKNQFLKILNKNHRVEVRKRKRNKGKKWKFSIQKKKDWKERLLTCMIELLLSFHFIQVYSYKIDFHFCFQFSIGFSQCGFPVPNKKKRKKNHRFSW